MEIRHLSSGGEPPRPENRTSQILGEKGPSPHAGGEGSGHPSTWRGWWGMCAAATTPPRPVAVGSAGHGGVWGKASPDGEGEAAGEGPEPNLPPK